MLSSFFRRARPLPPPPPVEPGAEVVEVEEGIGPPAPSPVPSGPAEMRRERRALARRREVELRDVGGLTVEMVRRDRFNPDLLIARANEVLLLEQRIHELDSLLAAEISVRGLRHVPHCKCGAPLPPGVHFCSHCGRPAASAPAIVACRHCGQPLPAEANFCPFCGNPVAADEYADDSAAGDFRDSTLVRPAPGEERTEA
jgi:double zinc ribbon protein